VRVLEQVRRFLARKTVGVFGGHGGNIFRKSNPGKVKQRGVPPGAAIPPAFARRRARLAAAQALSNASRRRRILAAPV